MLAQGVRQRVGAPEKHAAVPKIVATFDKLAGFGQVWLFGEAADVECSCIERSRIRRGIRRAGLDVAVAGFGARWADAEHDYVVSGGCDLDSPGESGAVLRRIG